MSFWKINFGSVLRPNYRSKLAHSRSGSPLEYLVGTGGLSGQGSDWRELQANLAVTGSVQAGASPVTAKLLIDNELARLNATITQYDTPGFALSSAALTIDGWLDQLQGQLTASGTLMESPFTTTTPFQIAPSARDLRAQSTLEWGGLPLNLDLALSAPTPDNMDGQITLDALGGVAKAEIFGSTQAWRATTSIDNWQLADLAPLLGQPLLSGTLSGTAKADTLNTFVQGDWTFEIRDIDPAIANAPRLSMATQGQITERQARTQLQIRDDIQSIDATANGTIGLQNSGLAGFSIAPAAPIQAQANVQARSALCGILSVPRMFVSRARSI